MGEAARQELNGTGVRVTLIEPGMVDTPVLRQPGHRTRSQPEDIARAVLYAVSQPAHVDVNEILIRADRAGLGTEARPRRPAAPRVGEPIPSATSC